MKTQKTVTACCEPAADCCDTVSGCCGSVGVGMQRRFISKQERKERLEQYRDALLKEVQGVEEALAEVD